MFKNRFIGVMSVLAIVIILAVSFSFMGVFASSPESELGLGANEVGLSTYKQSEWADYRGVPARVIEEGMAIYLASERSSAPVELAVSIEEGLAIYHASERNASSVELAASNEEGLAIYRQSERNPASVEMAVSNEAGMAIYLESERQGAAVAAVRLYNGEPFNAYQRSEWLGADQ